VEHGMVKTKKVIIIVAIIIVAVILVNKLEDKMNSSNNNIVAYNNKSEQFSESFEKLEASQDYTSNNDNTEYNNNNDDSELLEYDEENIANDGDYIDNSASDGYDEQELEEVYTSISDDIKAFFLSDNVTSQILSLAELDSSITITDVYADVYDSTEFRVEYLLSTGEVLYGGAILNDNTMSITIINQDDVSKSYSFDVEFNQ
jgi:archaellum component FlaF (FlaF/FlaG flagellin family)